jgi:hypothetical protein
MRTDVTIDGRQVICTNASLLGYSTRRARVGCFFVYSDEAGTNHVARMLGRVVFAPRLGAELKPVKNHILAMVLMSWAQSAAERWVDPATVIAVFEKPPTRLAAFFFAEKLPYDVHTMRRLMEQGTVSDSYIENHADRVAMFKERDEILARQK